MKLDVDRALVATLANYAVGTLGERDVMIVLSYARTPDESERGVALGELHLSVPPDMARQIAEELWQAAEDTRQEPD
ncbi:hypothetical protein AB4072_06905 [Microvirga sp. 2MCAF38]|uniref:hypothetical protein n=1 Tax=Microvirga sp. 2MCAF38 TaxID=3232989 RepID=UPI003F9448B9